jgi:hypothetical protein
LKVLSSADEISGMHFQNGRWSALEWKMAISKCVLIAGLNHNENDDDHFGQ